MCRHVNRKAFSKDWDFLHDLTYGTYCWTAKKSWSLNYYEFPNYHHFLPNELRKSVIFLMLPVITSMYSRLAQSCWICFWTASLSLGIAVIDIVQKLVSKKNKSWYRNILWTKIKQTTILFTTEKVTVTVSDPPSSFHSLHSSKPALLNW